MLAKGESPKVVDLFCGVGGLSLGFSAAGFDVVSAIDNNEAAVETYSRNFADGSAKCMDLSETEPEEMVSECGLDVEAADFVVGGPPCQGFSLMGNRKVDDERNELLLRFADYISHISPSYFLVENVEGLNVGEAREYLEEFIEKLESSGFEIKEPIESLNASNYGVPQERKRLFILGYQSDVPEPSYPSESSDNPNVWDAIGDLPNDLQSANVKDDLYEGALGEKSDYVEKINSWSPMSKETITGISGMDPVDHQDRIRERFSTVKPGGTDDISGYPRLEKEGTANTLRAGSSRKRGTHTAARPIHPVEPRVITVREAARLQSFPDWFQFHPTKYHGLRQIGNSVPPLVAKQIAEELKSIIKHKV